MQDIRTQVRKLKKDIASGTFKPSESTRATVFTEILNSNMPESEKETERLSREAQAMVQAGIETVSWSTFNHTHTHTHTLSLSLSLSKLTTPAKQASQPTSPTSSATHAPSPVSAPSCSKPSRPHPTPAPPTCLHGRRSSNYPTSRPACSKGYD